MEKSNEWKEKIVEIGEYLGCNVEELCNEVFPVIEQEIERVRISELGTFLAWLRWSDKKLTGKTIDSIVSLYLQERNTGDLIEKLKKIK